MLFNSIDELKDNGFKGFITISELNNDPSCIPKEKGVYMVVFKGVRRPKFVEKGTGGFFKNRDPNKSLDYLKDRWVKNTIVLYIGKAGGEGTQETLNDRIKKYLSFGRGNKVSHKGGRLIWQIKSSSKLVVMCWKALLDENPRIYEKELLTSFKELYGVLPFANLQL